MFQTIYSRMFVLAGAAIALVPSGLAQPTQPPSRALVTFSDGAACAGSPAGPPSFVALSATINATQLVSKFGSGGGASGRLKFDDVAITRNVDDCTVSLYGLFLPGRRINSVVVSYQTLVGTLYKETLRMTLTDVFIASIGDTEIGSAAPVEKVTLNFGRITIFDPVTNKSTSWDLAANLP